MTGPWLVSRWRLAGRYRYSAAGIRGFALLFFFSCVNTYIHACVCMYKYYFFDIIIDVCFDPHC